VKDHGKNRYNQKGERDKKDKNAGCGSEDCETGCEENASPVETCRWHCKENQKNTGKKTCRGIIKDSGEKAGG
jgi:hypothetical protein